MPIAIRVASILDEQGEIMDGIEVFTDNTPAVVSLERLAELERLAYIDTLTSLATRRYMEIMLNARLEEKWQFGVLFVDIDKFKNINDRYGHNRGDEVLKIVA